MKVLIKGFRNFFIHQDMQRVPIKGETIFYRVGRGKPIEAEVIRVEHHLNQNEDHGVVLHVLEVGDYFK